MRERVLIAAATAVAAISLTAAILGASKPAIDLQTVVIRSQGTSFVLDAYYQGQVTTTPPMSPKQLVPYLSNEIQPGARIIDLTGKVHVVQW
jgi:hypothetical protein